MSYTDRFQRLNLPTLKYRRLRGDMIQKLLSQVGPLLDNNGVLLDSEKDKTSSLNNYFAAVFTSEDTVMALQVNYLHEFWIGYLVDSKGFVLMELRLIGNWY